VPLSNLGARRRKSPRDTELLAFQRQSRAATSAWRASLSAGAN
jgi:hypothetical protein